MSPLLLALVAEALAVEGRALGERRGFMLHVESGPVAVEGEMVAEVVGPDGRGRTASPRDDGVHPDLSAGDRRWSASVTEFSADTFTITITAGEHTWTGSGEFDPTLADPIVVVQLQPDGTADVSIDTNLFTLGPGDSTLARGTLPFPFGWGGWLLLLATVAGGTLVWTRRRSWRLPVLPPPMGVTPVRRVGPAELGAALDEGRFVCVGGLPREPAGAWLLEAPAGLLPVEAVALAVRHGAALLVLDPAALDQRDERPAIATLEALAAGRAPLWIVATSV